MPGNHRWGRDLRYPSRVSRTRGNFDRFTDATMRIVSSGHFFVGLLVFEAAAVAWGFWRGFQGIVDTMITVAGALITIVLVILLQNTTRQADLALQHKLNAICLALLSRLDAADKEWAVEELQAAIGLERHESAEGPRD